MVPYHSADITVVWAVDNARKRSTTLEIYLEIHPFQFEQIHKVSPEYRFGRGDGYTQLYIR
jgi:hypothetical protein